MFAVYTTLLVPKQPFSITYEIIYSNQCFILYTPPPLRMVGAISETVLTEIKILKQKATGVEAGYVVHSKD